MREILSASQETGWVLEPRAMQLFSLLGLDIPGSCWTDRIEEAIQFAEESGYLLLLDIT
jgi:hypothetical protein